MTRWMISVGLALAACAPPAAEPALDIAAAPANLDALGRTAQLRVVATNADGTLGRGAVTLEATPGELDATSFELDAYGTQRTTLTCVATDPACTPGASITVKASWTPPKGDVVKATRELHIATPPPTWTPASCPPEAKLVYLFTDEATLYSDHPPSKSLLRLGQLQCAAGTAHPNSMAVSQDGLGWLNYSDGSLFVVNLRTRKCTATSFVPPAGWTDFGMGFSPDSATSVTETLFIASPQGLAKVDLQAMRATVVGPFGGAYAGRGAELTSTPEGALFGFFVPSDLDAGMQLARVAKDTAAVSQPRAFPTLTLGASFAYAFSSWSPDFYLYTSSDGANTTVTRYSPATDVASTYMTAPAGVRVLGAGVSRCGGD